MSLAFIDLEQHDIALLLMTLGAMFLIGLGADLLGRFTILPRVTLLMLAGVLIGPSVLDRIPQALVDDWFPPLTYIALSMIGFLLGQKLTLAELKRRGVRVLAISIGEVLGAFAIVAVALSLLGVDPAVALIIAAIAPASAPAATYDVVKETGAKGEFVDTLLSVVAIDDAWGLLLFTFVMAWTGMVIDASSATVSTGLSAGLAEIGASAGVGLAIGLPMAFLTGRIRSGEPTLAEAMGLVLLCAGIATWLDLSPILSAMVMGATVGTLARHHNRPFHAIEGVEWPFMILFFVLAGASMQLNSLTSIGWVGAVYILARSAGLYVGAFVGARAANADSLTRRWLGLGLLPQAGVALGMALLATQRFPKVADVVLPLILATTVVFELVAPMVTRMVLHRAGSTPTPTR